MKFSIPSHHVRVELNQYFVVRSWQLGRHKSLLRQIRVLDYSTAIERVVRKKRRFLLVWQLKLRWNESFRYQFCASYREKDTKERRSFFPLVLLDEIIKKSYFNRRVVLYVEDERYRRVCQYFISHLFISFLFFTFIC